MNRIYKVVWSRARQCYVVASELAHRSGKKSAAVLAVAACTMSIWGGHPVFAADTSMEMGPNAIAKGNGAIATGSNTAAIGKGAVATGNNLTAEQLQELLNKKKTYEDNLKTAQSNADASQQAYNEARSEYETADVNNGIVDRANEAIKGYQDQINSTLKPNADTADAAYTKAKNDYDTLYNDFQNRIATIKTLDFTLYQDGSAAGYDLDKMATDLKTKTESGTSFNEPLDFYKGYIQNYIKAEGDLRQNKIINESLTAESNNSSNGAPGAILSKRFEWTTIDENSAKVLGLKGTYGPNIKSNTTDTRVFGFLGGDSYSGSRGYFYLNGELTNNRELVNDNGYSTYIVLPTYSETNVLTDEDYNKQLIELKNKIDLMKNITVTQASKLKAIGFTSNEIDNLSSSANTFIEKANSWSTYALTAEHEQYLYEQERDAGNTSEALKHLSLKEEALKKKKH